MYGWALVGPVNIKIVSSHLWFCVSFNVCISDKDIQFTDILIIICQNIFSRIFYKISIKISQKYCT